MLRSNKPHWVEIARAGNRSGPNRRHRQAAGITLPEILIIVVGVVVVAAILFPVFAQRKMGGGPDRTRENLKQCGLAALMYAADYDGRLPRADQWMDETHPYIHNDSVFHDPSLTNRADYGFAFRDTASMVRLKNIRSDAEFVIEFQSVLMGRNAHSELWSMPMPTRDDRFRGDAVCFADGHARRFVTPPGYPHNIEEMIAADVAAGPVDRPPDARAAATPARPRPAAAP